ncbi:diacylglycerol kinase family lipid kinase [Actinocorallia sp. API 0066]|uniref:diacylglycerol/lipid kinase family protein n=1 Tax=Actinocorallia sp. API 0066 TaxID=2896846 RepID=UPI001E4DBE94|nr:diacylglycerol kinase family lipid kinase [Actinocorallia sp. API 0066]MCD0448565.1 diacylglycerol kinase family lipid kinase [Actinocorallia sp. API 0066]
MRSFTAVVNPTAGGGSAAKKLFALARLLREAGAPLQVDYSRDLAHAKDLARAAAARGDTVLGVGGDGIAGTVGGALVGTDAEYAIVPAGRGNDFARQIDLPTAPEALVDLLLHGEAKPTDALEVEGEPALGSVYAGVDANANAYANKTWLRGRASYTWGAVKAVAAWRSTTYTVVLDGTPHEYRAYAVVAANSGYYGYNRHVAPSASVEDGLLDIVVIKESSRPLLARILLELESGTHVTRPQVEVLRAKEVHLSATRPLRYGSDGELPGHLPITVRALPGALNLIRP